MKIGPIVDNRTWRVVLASVLVTALALSVSVASGADLFSGTWKVNPAKSQFNPGPGLKAQIVKFEIKGEEMNVIIDSTGADGKTIHSEWTGRLDGKDYPMKGDPNVDTRSFKKVDDYTLDIIAKKAGKVLTTTRTVYDRDGKTRISRQSGTDSQGRKIQNTIFSEKQP